MIEVASTRVNTSTQSMGLTTPISATSREGMLPFHFQRVDLISSCVILSMPFYFSAWLALFDLPYMSKVSGTVGNFRFSGELEDTHLNASRQGLRGNDTMGKRVWK